MSAAPYEERGYCHLGGHWSEELHCRTKSCRECEDVFLMRVRAGRKPDTQGY